MYKYFKSKKHFENYINKIINDNINSLQNEEVAPNYLFNFIYENMLAEVLSFRIKCIGIEAIKYDYIKNFIYKENFNININPNKFIDITNTEFYSFLTNEYKSLSNKLRNESGIYIYYTIHNNENLYLYVGTSVNLGDRIFGSFTAKFKKDFSDKQLYIQYSISNKTDAAILEMYYIGKLSPIMNITGNYIDNVTLEILNIPELSFPIECNIPVTKQEFAERVLKEFNDEN